MAPQIPGLRWLGRTLEQVMFGDHAGLYRQFVRAVIIVTAALVLANAIVWLELGDIAPETAALLETAGSIAVTAFIIVGALQLLVMARVLDRESTNVATQAATLEERADEVNETADTLESTADELETTAEGLESRADRLENAAEKLADQATEVSEEFKGRSQSELADQAAQLRDEAAELREETADVKAETSDAKAQTKDIKETTEEVSEELAAEQERMPSDPDQDVVEEKTEGGTKSENDAENDEG